MPHYETNSVYVKLKGDWGEDLLAEVNPEIETFIEDLEGDDCGENNIEEYGDVHVYDANIPDESALDHLMGVLQKGPAWVIRVEQGDELQISNYVYGPNLDRPIEITGNMRDPDVPFSKIGDRVYIDKVKSAMLIDDMEFTKIK